MKIAEITSLKWRGAWIRGVTIFTGAGGSAGAAGAAEELWTGTGSAIGHAASVVVTVRVWSPKLAMRSSLPPSAST
jgi:hypothetical protein